MYQKDSNTVALLHFDNDFSDECGNVWTAFGNVQVDSSQKKIGNKSLFIPAGSYLQSNSNAYAFAGSDFTIEFWVYSATPNSAEFTSSAIVEGARGVIACGDTVAYGNNASFDARFYMPGLTANVWTHIAVVRKGNQFLYFVQGQLISQATVSNPITSTKFAIGARYGDGMYPTKVPIYIDEFRISNKARWTQNFTPGLTSPTNLVAIAGKDIVNLSWNGVTGVNSYTIKRSTTPGGGYQIIARNITNNTYSDSGVTAGATYYYVVTANSTGGESVDSNEASAMLGVNAPKNLIAIAANAQVTLSWGAITNVQGYNVKRSEVAGGPYVTIATVSTNSYTDNTVVNGTTYYYVVSAIDGANESANSNEVFAMPPVSTPANLIAIAGDSQVSLSWDAVNSVSGYNVKRSESLGGPYTVIDTTTTNNYIDSSVINGRTYYYVVTAIAGNSESANSNEVSATPVAVEPIVQAFLKVTMIDSSEREFQLTTAEIEGFISWFNNHISGDSASYMLNKNVGLRNSKEYLAFDKIISFEVTPVAE